MDIKEIAGKTTIVVPGQGTTNFRVTAVPGNDKWPLNHEPGIRIATETPGVTHQGPTIPISRLDDLIIALLTARQLLQFKE